MNIEHEAELIRVLIVDLGLRIQAARKQANLSRLTLASHMNMSKSAIAMWERGERCPTVPNLYRLAVLCGVRVHELLPAHAVKTGPQRLIDILATMPKESREALHDLIEGERQAAVAASYTVITQELERSSKGGYRFSRRTTPKNVQKPAPKRKLKSVS